MIRLTLMCAALLSLVASSLQAQTLKQKQTVKNRKQVAQKVERQEREPSKDEFVSVETDPRPLTDISTLINYPEVERARGREGRVTLEALIGKNGDVEKVDIVQGVTPAFDSSAVAAMRQMKFSPAVSHGEPVRVWYTQPISFKLGLPATPPPSNGNWNNFKPVK